MKCNVFNVFEKKTHIDMLQDHHNQLQRQGCYDISSAFKVCISVDFWHYSCTAERADFHPIKQHKSDDLSD